ncbi:MAG: terminase family protein [Pyrinomonadaceae bacterium]
MPSNAELLQEAEFRACRGKNTKDFDACELFLRKYVAIQHPEQGAILFDLRTAQSEALFSCMHDRYVIILKARQLGWSTLMACYSLWLGLFWPDQTIVMLSKTERDAHKLLAKSDYAYRRLPDWLKARATKRLDRNVGKITFDNGSSIESMPSKEDPARGSAVSLVIVDEWAFLDNPEDAWASIEPITDVGGRVIGLSTANGAGTFFHTFWTLAVAKKSGFTPLFYAWFANTERDDNWYESKRASMLPWQLAQEYPDNPEEAFIRSGNPVFDVDLLRQIKVKEPTRYEISSSLPVRAPNGVLRVWSLRDPLDAYVIGADVAEGLEHGDYSSAHVVSANTSEIVAKWHGRLDPDLFGEELARLGLYYNTAMIGVEVNNHGLTTNKALQRVGYPRIYQRKRLDGPRKNRKTVDSIGWLTTRVSKPLMIDELARDLRNDLILTDAETIGELLTYVRDDKGQMSGSPFDDQVVSLAIANQMRQYARINVVKDDVNDYWTFTYFMRQVTNEGKPGERYKIGADYVRST